MPGGDGTGPAGRGPMTGRAAGFCAGYPVAGYMNPVAGRGAWGYGANYLPAQQAYAPAYPRAYPYAASPYFPRFGWGRGRGRGRGWGMGRGFGRRFW